MPELSKERTLSEKELRISRNAYLLAREQGLSKQECSYISRIAANKEVPEHLREHSKIKNSMVRQVINVAAVYEALSHEYSNKKKAINKEMEAMTERRQLNPYLVKTFIERVEPVMEKEEILEQGHDFNPMHMLTEQAWEDYLGMDIGHMGWITDDRDRDKLEVETDILEKHYNKDFDGLGREDRDYDPDVKEFENRISNAKEESRATVREESYEETKEKESGELELTRFTRWN